MQWLQVTWETCFVFLLIGFAWSSPCRCGICGVSSWDLTDHICVPTSILRAPGQCMKLPRLQNKQPKGHRTFESSHRVDEKEQGNEEKEVRKTEGRTNEGSRQ